MSLDLKGGELASTIHGRMMMWIDDPGGNAGDLTFVQADGLPKHSYGYCTCQFF